MQKKDAERSNNWCVPKHSYFLFCPLVHVCVFVSARACVCVCVCACLCACVRAIICVHVYITICAPDLSAVRCRDTCCTQFRSSTTTSETSVGTLRTERTNATNKFDKMIWAHKSMLQRLNDCCAVAIFCCFAFLNSQILKHCCMYE